MSPGNRPHPAPGTPDEPGHAAAALARAQSATALARGEVRRLTEENARLLREARDQVATHVELNAALRDAIAARDQALDALRESEQTFFLAFDKAPFASGLSRLPEGVLVAVNAAFEQTFGYTRQEAIGKTSLELGLNPDADGRAAIVAALERHGLVRGLELALRTRSGDERIMAVNVDLVEIGGARYVLNTTQDVTERRRVEERARRQSARLQALARVSRELAAARLDFDGVVAIVAQAAMETVGDMCVMTVLEPDGETLRPVAVTHRDPEAAAFTRRLLEETPHRRGAGAVGRVAQTGQPLLLPDVDQSSVRATVRPELHPYLERFGVHSIVLVPLRAGERVIGTLGLTRDRPGQPYTADDQAFLQDLAETAALAIENTRLLAAERAARSRAEDALRGRDALLAGVAHDLKAPLTAIRGHAQLIARRAAQAERAELPGHAGGVLPGAVANSAGQITAGVDQMVRWIDELAEIGRLEAGQPLILDRRPTDLATLARRVVAVQGAAAPAHRIDVRAEPPEVVGLWDAARLERVLHNLVANAIKFSPGGGEVVLEVTREAGDARLVVRDRGIGFTPAELPRVFEPLYRSPAVAGAVTGSGLGLAIVRRFAEQHGGRVAVESEPGRGSTFTVTLPLARPGFEEEPSHSLRG